MASSAQAVLAANDQGIAKNISDRLSQELVFALVGPISSGVSTAAGYLHDILSGDFKYTVAPIMKPSDVIRQQASLASITVPETAKTASYVTDMQNAGNSLRKKFGNNYLIEKVIEKIRVFRENNDGYSGELEIPGRRAYIIDSVKNMEELELLRDIYRETLCLVGVFAPDELRNQRLADQGYASDERTKVMSRDQGEIVTFGQATRKIFEHADFYICNDRRVEDLRISVQRYLDLLFDTAVHTPTRAESAMYEADAAAASSACMSRQVGASIVSAEGELIAVGWNDVPKFGGSLYSEDDRSIFDESVSGMVDNDKRCYNWAGGKCHNDDRRNALMDEVTRKALEASGADASKSAAIRNAVSQTDIKAIIEYSRSIHAEMEAILSVAREGKHSLVGATLYTNTYPCHNCARHIVASGIKRVIYIKPYLKSLAIKLHNDVISELPDARNKVIFSQFHGVAPSNYLKLFRPKAERKSEGKLTRIPRENAVPVFRVPLDAQREYEDKVIAEIAAKEQS